MEPKYAWGDVTISVEGKDIVGINHPPIRRTRPSPWEKIQAMIDLNKAIETYLEILRTLPPERVRTEVTPKWHNRARRKQRLTRLQRRHKRQNKHNRRKA